MISANFWTVKGFTQKVTLKELKEIMLNDPDPIVGGEVRKIGYKRVCPGVYEIFLKPLEASHG